MSMTERRTFLQRLAAGTLALSVAPSFSRASAPTSPTSPLAPATAATGPGSLGAWDEKWMDVLTGRYKQFFDAEEVRDATVFGVVRNLLNGYRDAYGTKDTEVSAVVGLHGVAASLAFKDSAWAKFRLGQQGSITDPATRMPALINIVVTASPALSADASIPALQGRGVVVALCNNSLNRITRTLEAGGYGKAEAMRAELLGEHLLPGVVLVPAMVVASNRLQMRGFGYWKLG